ncbi:MAG: rRNA maturation RNase YbeY [Bacteroidetes bacterium]|nr:MAG: rRNA maturation RNase YbeY [Bacteroidota bacterium]
MQFFSEDTDFILDQPSVISDWVKSIISKEEKSLRQINFILCSDEYLHKINVEYLNHDTLTDIITFPYSDPPIIHSDIFISVERVEENAHKFKTSFPDELHRVIIHGVLHLCGYGDKTEEEKSFMRQKENEALKLLV